MDATHFVGFFLRILRILLHLKQLSDKTTLHRRSEISPFSRNLVIAERKRRGQVGVIWTEDHKRLDANNIAWIYLIQSNTTDCDKLGLMRAQESYIDTSTAQMTAPCLFGGFSFRGLKKLNGGDSWIHSTAHRKEHSKTEFGKNNSEKKFGESETFYRSRFSPATGVTFLSVNYLEFGHFFLSWWIFTVQEVKFFLIQTVKKIFFCGDHPLGGGNENSEYRHVATSNCFPEKIAGVDGLCYFREDAY